MAEARALAALAHVHWLQDRFEEGRAVLADEPGAIDGKTHRQPLHGHIMHDLVIGALQEG